MSCLRSSAAGSRCSYMVLKGLWERWGTLWCVMDDLCRSCSGHAMVDSRACGSSIVELLHVLTKQPADCFQQLSILMLLLLVCGCMGVLAFCPGALRHIGWCSLAAPCGTQGGGS